MTRKELLIFMGYLSAELPELKYVEAGRLIEAVEKFRSKKVQQVLSKYYD
jgi:hypothetical protein